MRGGHLHGLQTGRELHTYKVVHLDANTNTNIEIWQQVSVVCTSSCKAISRISVRGGTNFNDLQEIEVCGEIRMVILVIRIVIRIKMII